MNDFPVMAYKKPYEDGEGLPADATPLDFLQRVYRNENVPLPVRMKAAIECLGYVHPKLAVTISAIDGRSFAAQMEDMVRRSGRSNVIDAQANYGNVIDAVPQPDPKG